MSPRTRQPALAAVLILLVLAALILGGVLPAVSAGLAAQPSPPPQMESISDAAILPRLVLVADPNPAPEPHVILAPQEVDGVERVQTANIHVNYAPGFSSAARTAFEYAVSLWESWITSPVTIVINASWEPDDPSVLGSAGPVTIHRITGSGFVRDTWYFAALANKLNGSDLAATADIGASFNSAFNGWYYGTAGTPPVGKYDLVSVVMHEIAHGLGFAGSMGFGLEDGCNSGTGCWGYSGYPVIYDRFTENATGQALLSFPSNSIQLGFQLTTTDNLYFDSPSAVVANGGNRPPLYFDSLYGWQHGSSYSHLGESFNETPNRLMTFSLSPQEVVHHPGPIALAMLNDMGWANTTQETSTPGPTPTRTPTPTVTRTPTPMNTPSVWRHLPSILHFSFTPTPRPFSISGSVRYRGSPIQGINLTLQKVNGAGDTTQVASTVTTAGGSYRFDSPPALGTGESYYVQFQNNANNINYLWAWYTPRTWSTVTGPVTYAAFDIADITLTAPEDAAVVNFPATFTWERRPAVISDSYEFHVYYLDNNDFNPEFASDPLGYTVQYTLNSLPVDNVHEDGKPFLPGIAYVWEVWANGPDGGYGVSLDYRQVTFGPARQSLTFSPEELGRLVEQSRRLRMDLRR